MGGGRQTLPQKHQHPRSILLEFRHSSPPLPSVKTIENLRSIRKFKHARHLINLGFCIFRVQMLKQSLSRLLTGQNNLFEGLAFKYIVETIIPYYYCMLVKSLI